MVGGDSVSNPLRVDWLDVTDRSVTGRLGRTFLPGKNHDGLSGLEHARSARIDTERLRDEYGVNTLVLLNEDHEIARLVDNVAPPAGPQNLRAALRESEIELLRFPIPDTGTPHPEHDAELRVLLGGVVDRLRAGRTVAVACRGGIGRTGTILGLLLIELGCTPAAAVQRVRDMKRECIDQGPQEAFVRAWKPAPGIS